MLTLAQAMQRAIAAYNSGAWDEAEWLCRRVLGSKTNNAQALSLLGIIAAQTRRLQEAAELLGRAVAANPASAAAQNSYGMILKDLGRLDEALDSFERALKHKPDFSDAHHNRGLTLREMGRLNEALVSYDRALEIRPDDAAVCNNRGLALEASGRLDAALDSYDHAIRLKPDLAEAHYNRGNALRAMRRLDQAIDSYGRATELRPNFADAYNNRGNVLRNLRRLDGALDSYDRALEIQPESPEICNNRGNVLHDLKRPDEALESYDRAVRINPGFAEAHNNRGNVLHDLKRLDEALESYERALRLEPSHPYAQGAWVHVRMKLCDWGNIEDHVARLLARIEREERASPPFPALSLTGSLPLQRKAAGVWARDKYPASLALPPIPKRGRRERIRIGYFSADFRDHPVSHLMAGVFENHDKSRFECTAFSFGPNTNDVVRKRIEAAFDRFIDVRIRADADVVTLARDLEVDIAIDLGGFTEGSRTAIFALRAAPIQVSYVGYLGTMGADYIDYLIADRTIIPREHQRHYSEKIVYLPSYHANDSSRMMADRLVTRSELGLPARGFVFCCFNNSYKITPETFDSWMRILKRVDSSVLFLYASNEWAAANLKREAAARGIDTERLVFGARLSRPEYLARYRAADLFLDTLPYNAGTTASDALSAGLPLLTCLGSSFAGRVAASLLETVGLRELITATREQYEALAVELANDPQRLVQIRHKLERNRPTALLFDTRRFVGHLEHAYTQMYEQYQAGRTPEGIVVSA